MNRADYFELLQTGRDETAASMLDLARADKVKTVRFRSLSTRHAVLTELVNADGGTSEQQAEGARLLSELVTARI